MDNKKIIISLFISIFIVIIATAGVTYAYLSFSTKQTTANVLNSACFDFSLTDSNRINYLGYPMSEQTAKTKVTPYEFTITNTCTSNVASSEYQIVLNIFNTTNIDLSYIYYSLDGGTAAKLNTLQAITLPSNLVSSNASISKSYVLTTATLNSTTKTKTHKLLLWIDENACSGTDCETKVMNKKFEAQISIYNEAK